MSIHLPWGDRVCTKRNLRDRRTCVTGAFARFTFWTAGAFTFSAEFMHNSLFPVSLVPRLCHLAVLSRSRGLWRWWLMLGTDFPGNESVDNFLPTFVNMAKLTIIKIILIYPRTSGHATLMIKVWSNWIPIVNGRSVVIIGDYIHFPNRTNCVESLKLQIWFTPATECIWLIQLIYATGVKYHNTDTFVCCWYYHYKSH